MRSSKYCLREAMVAAQHPAVLLVDGVSSIGSLEFRQDEWSVDVAITGSQKGFMMPAGLGMVSLSPKAMERIETAGFPRHYFDLRPQVLHNGRVPDRDAVSRLSPT